jgi:hypothetical protein
MDKNRPLRGIVKKVVLLSFFRYHTPINHGIVVLSLVHCELKVHLSVLSFFNRFITCCFLFDLFDPGNIIPSRPPKNGLDTTSVLYTKYIPSQNSFLRVWIVSQDSGLCDANSFRGEEVDSSMSMAVLAFVLKSLDKTNTLTPPLPHFYTHWFQPHLIAFQKVVYLLKRPHTVLGTLSRIVSWNK